jgi:hypothetical protein
MQFDEVEVKHVTEKAMLLKFPDGEEHWIPKSQIEETSVDEKGDTGTVVLKKWICEQRGLI